MNNHGNSNATRQTQYSLITLIKRFELINVDQKNLQVMKILDCFTTISKNIDILLVEHEYEWQIKPVDLKYLHINLLDRPGFRLPDPNQKVTVRFLDRYGYKNLEGIANKENELCFIWSSHREGMGVVYIGEANKKKVMYGSNNLLYHPKFDKFSSKVIEYFPFKNKEGIHVRWHNV